MELVPLLSTCLEMSLPFFSAVAAARQAFLPLEGALLHPDPGLPAVLQEGKLKDDGDGRLHLQNQAGRGG